MSNEEHNIKKSLKQLEEKVELLDQKIMFLFSKVTALTESIEAKQPPLSTKPTTIAEKTVREQPKIVPKSTTTETSGTEYKPYKRLDVDIGYVKPEESPPSTKSERDEPQKPLKTPLSKLKEVGPPISSRVKEELFPYFLLLGFYLLLSVTLYVGTIFLINWLTQIGQVTQLNVFLYLMISSLIFITGSIFSKRFLVKRSMNKFLMFPWSFLGVGIAGVFISYVVSTTVIVESPKPLLLWFLAIGGAVTCLVISIKFKNEFLIGEAYLCLNLIALIPVIVNPTDFGQYVGYIFFAFFFVAIVLAYSLAKLKISASPSIVALISFPVFCFIPAFYKVMAFNTLLVVIPSCLVAVLLIENAYDYYHIYANNIMRTIITIIDFILPLSCFFFLIFLRDEVGLYSWEILISALLLLITYTFAYSNILTKRFEEYNITNPFLVNLLFLVFLNAVTFLTLLTEINRVSETQILFSSFYVLLAVIFSMIPIILKRDTTDISSSSILNFILPLASYFLLIFKRVELQLLSWPIFLVSSIFYASYFIGLYRNQIFQLSTIKKEEDTHEKDSMTTKVLEAITIGAINIGIIFALTTEINTNRPDVALFSGLYLALLIGSSMFTMNSQLRGGLSILSRLILSLALLEVGFIIIFVNSSVNNIGIALNYNLVFLFLFCLLSLYLFRKTNIAYASTASLLGLGCINLFIANLVTDVIDISKDFTYLFVLGISICFGVLSILQTINKFPIEMAKEKVTVSHLHSLSILSLTSSLWYMAQDHIIFYLFYSGVLITIGMWLVNLHLKKKEDSEVSEERLGIFVIVISLISIPAKISTISPLVIIVSISMAIMLAIIPLVIKNYDIGVPFIIYTSLITSLFAFPTLINPFGEYWLLPIIYILPTLSILFVSTKHDEWKTRIGTTLLATLTLIVISLRLKETGAEILIAISSGILIVFPIIFFLFNMWSIKDEIKRKNATVEYPIDLFLVTFGAIIANSIIIPQDQLLDLTRESLVFSFLMIGAVIGSIIYLIHVKLGRITDINLTPQSKLFLSLGFISIMHFLYVFTGVYCLLRAEFLITLLISVTLVTLIYFYYHKFDTTLLLPAFVSTLITPVLFVLENMPGRPPIEDILANPLLIRPLSIIITSIFFIYLLTLSFNWIESRNEKITIACFVLGSLSFILSSFIQELNIFRALPDYVPFLVMGIWLLSTCYKAWKTRMQIPKDLYNGTIWAITIAMLAMTTGWLSGSEFTFTSEISFFSYSLSIVATLLLIGLFSAILQYKFRPTPMQTLSHIIALQILYITIGSISFFGINVVNSAHLTLFYVFFSIFTIIFYMILTNLVFDYVLVKTDLPNAHLACIMLFIPFYIFSLIAVIINETWFGFVPFVLALLFYGISYKSQLKSNSLVGMVAIAISTFYLSPAVMILTYTSFIILTSVMATILIMSFILYKKTENELQFVPALFISLITIAISGFLSPMAFELSFGLAFVLALLGVTFATYLDVKVVQIVSSVTSGIIGISYIFYMVINAGAEDFQYGSLGFLFLGIFLIIFSYILYIRRKEKLQQNITKE